jgi:hypothetical protein
MPIDYNAPADLFDFGRDVRNIIGSPEYRTLFDTRLAEDSQAKGKWHTSAGGIYYAVGIGGSVLGPGADILLVDDPFSSMEDALSEITRKNVWDKYTGTAYKRLMPNGAIVVINHRMNEDDLSGCLLAQQAAGGDKWEVIELLAISESPYQAEHNSQVFLSPLSTTAGARRGGFLRPNGYGLTTKRLHAKR